MAFAVCRISFAHSSRMSCKSRLKGKWHHACEPLPAMSAIYLQHAENQSFYYGKDRWVMGKARARRFAHAHDAISFCAERDLAPAQVHVCFGPGAADVIIPVTAEMAVAPAPADSVVW
jgi:hypothetical protein